MNAFDVMKDKLKELPTKRDMTNYARTGMVHDYVEMNDVIEIVNEVEQEFGDPTLCYLGSPCEYQTEKPNYNNGWIPCSERLPESNKAVLVSTNTGEVDVDYYGATLKDFVGLKGTHQKALAWRPLPIPYEKEVKNG